MLHRYTSDISSIERPALFTWPFHYVPHPLSRLACEQLKQYLASRNELSEEIARGKMFGVLVVETSNGSIGFLAAFSGNLEGKNHHEYFVPPIYDMLQPDDFFRRGEAEISAINREIESRLQSIEYISSKQELRSVIEEGKQDIEHLRCLHKERKAERDRRRNRGEDNATLIAESQHDNADMQRLKRDIRLKEEACYERYNALENEIERLKHERQQRSSALQMQLFEQFQILNARGEVKSLCELFAPTPQAIPPAGAGECAAPKLLQYAYKHLLKPLCMAEFWLGASPRGEVRHNGVFYPACNSKCKPILEHMLQGLDVEPNPLQSIVPPEPSILWEDEWLVAIDKPCGMLSVEGKSGVRSVERWAHERYPDATGPMIIHRLDQSTSGIMLIAKDKATHYAVQKQFITRRISKRYTALLDGVVETTSGRIDLRQKLDYDNRPRQMVSPDGKPAHTEYRVLGIENGLTRIEFYPITGRTHQLRLHSAHSEGLNTPIVGDDIYGREHHTNTHSSEHCDTNDNHNRLCLHASHLEFYHPMTGALITIDSPATF